MRRSGRAVAIKVAQIPQDPRNTSFSEISADFLKPVFCLGRWDALIGPLMPSAIDNERKTVPIRIKMIRKDREAGPRMQENGAYSVRSSLPSRS